MSEQEALYTQLCPDCGIMFGIPKNMEAVWRASHKGFYCPNGHSLSWRGEAPAEKELKDLRTQVQDLQSKLDVSTTEISTLKQKLSEMETELDIWRPTEKAV